MKNLSILFFLFIFTTVATYSQVTINVPGDYATIQAAIDAANTGDIVLVADGTYYENINYKGKAITVASHFLNDGDEAHISNTIIDGSQPSHPDSGSVVSFLSGEDTTSIICGFTITGGTGTLSLVTGDVSGGGIVTLGAGGTIKNNIIEYNFVNNDSSYANGAIVADLNGLGLIIENNIIRYNTTTGNEWSTGGGIAVFDFTYSSYARIANNVIMNNTVTDPNFATGGGIEINGGSNEFYIIGNYIKGNVCSGSGWGGGIDFYDCSPIAKNNLIIGNSAPYGGGVILDNVTITSSKSELNNSRRKSNRFNRLKADQFNSSKVLLASSFENNTIINNSATDEGGGVTVWGTLPQLMNFIVWGNTAPVNPQIAGTPDIQYSDVEGGYTGTGNLDVNPEFDPTSDFYALFGSSPCVDAGNPAAMYNDVEDPGSPGNALWPAWGTITNDMGHCGGPASLWGLQEWPIPVELISFAAVVNGYNVNLSWSTVTETNNMGFEVQRSSNVTDFSRIGFVEGHGTVSEVQNYSFTDKNLEVGTYTYRLKQIDFDGTSEFSNAVEVEILVPNVFALDQNYPNPFNPSTLIKYSVPENGFVKLSVYNLVGEEVRVLVNETADAGFYEVAFNAANLPSGTYFYRLQAGNTVQLKKMILLK